MRRVCCARTWCTRSQGDRHDPCRGRECGRPVVQRLRQDGHDTTYVAELAPSIAADEVLQEANNRGALLLTEDKDFGELVHRLGRVHAGVVLIRLAGLSPSVKADAVAQA